MGGGIAISLFENIFAYILNHSLTRSNFIMIKKLILCTVMAASAIIVHAQSYRGFVDGYGMIALGNLDGLKRANPVWSGNEVGLSEFGTVIGGISTTHGVQVLPKLFIGAGVGLYAGTNHYNFPVFADIRFDMFSDTRKVTPFVGIKLGYMLCMDDRTGNPVYTGNSYKQQMDYDDDGDGIKDVIDRAETRYLKNQNAFFFQPSVGMRIRLRSHCGLNIALSYIPLRTNIYKDYDIYTEQLVDKLKTVTRNYLALSFGVDF